MQTFARLACVAVLTLASTACRQTDGPTPTPTPDQQNEIGDLSRNLVNLVNKDPAAAEDLRSDLAKYSPNEDATVASHELTRRLAEAVTSGARLDEPTAQKLARTLWLAMTATEYSERQVEALENELKGTLVAAGVAENRAQPVADQLGVVQERITANPKRWYQVF
jgi:hypothetical protein